MVCNHKFTIFFILVILSHSHFTFTVDATYFNTEVPSLKPIGHVKTIGEEKANLRAMIGSRPPRCEKRCSSCVQCEAVQVPTNPQIKPKLENKASSKAVKAAFSRDDDDGNSNYKPLSWKCKCGKYIFNP